MTENRSITIRVLGEFHCSKQVERKEVAINRSVGVILQQRNNFIELISSDSKDYRSIATSIFSKVYYLNSVFAISFELIKNQRWHRPQLLNN